MTDKHVIQISADQSGQSKLLLALESLLPIQFAELSKSSSSGRIFANDETVDRNQIYPSAALELFLPKIPATTIPSDFTLAKVRFSDEADVPFPFKGRTITAKLPRTIKGLTIRSDETVLLQSEHGALWVVTRNSGGKTYRSSIPLVSQSLPEALNGDVFVAILPLLQFLREASGQHLIKRPGLRASFIFDDPNLHWPRYGYVDYRDMAARADRGNYHASFATIPLDAWFTHKTTAEIFRSNPRRLSLCVHGNDHAKRELAGHYSDAERIALLHQSLRRIEKLEKKSGLAVSRVMVPPHGACLESMLAEMPVRGFESACISSGSLVAHNQDKAWTAALGYLPSEIIGGCPVMPRWAMTGCATEHALMAAYLGQAMVLRGHHNDLKQGVELLDELARFVNGIGAVRWMNLEELSRTSFEWRIVGRTCWLRPYGRRIDFQLPDGVESLRIEAGQHNPVNDWKIWTNNSAPEIIRAGLEIPWPVSRSRSFNLEICASREKPSDAPQRRTPLKAVVRRALTEVRDRLRMN